jgi:outer membrane lipoprotein-sorting protein
LKSQLQSPLQPKTAPTLLLALLLTGCSILPTTRKLPVPKAPALTQTVDPDELVAQLNKRWAALKTLNARVDIQASEFNTNAGLEKDSPTFGGLVFMQKPEMLRVFGKVPVIGTEAFDIVGDGKTFTMYIPHNNMEYKGTYAVAAKTASTSLEEKLRPGFFFDAIVVRGLEPNDEYMVTADTVIGEDPARKHLYSVPEYKLTIMRSKTGSPELEPRRVVYFHRDNLLPSQQDIYDSEGNLVTQVTYGPYKDFDSIQYPSSITINRPLDKVQIVLTIDSIKQNAPLSADQFEINNIPSGTPVKDMH